jgi:tRNA modification GTPase
VCDIAFLNSHISGTLITRARHRKHLEDTSTALQQTKENLGALEISSEYLKQAIDSIGRITGRVDIEDVLDVLFKDFCIGK